jgi:hypothetical protein
MMTKVQMALAMAAVVFAAPQAEAQRKASIPFHVSAVSNTPATETLSGVFSEEVPVGKRLVVEHLSLLVFSLDVTEELSLANCMITGRGLDSKGGPQDVQHFIPLVTQGNLATRRVSLTGGGPLTMRLEAGPISVTCSSGSDGQNLAVLQAHLSGELVTK